MARPTKLTPTTVQRLTQALRIGADYKLACGYAGISYGCFREWMKAGEQAKRGQFFEFYEAVEKARADAAMGWLAKIEAAANAGNWKAAQYKLACLYPETYGNRSSIRAEHSGPDGGAIQIDHYESLLMKVYGDDDAGTALTA